MKRFYVCRAYFKWKGKMYRKGDLLPAEFTHHDKARSIYNSRIGECEVPVEEITSANSQETVPPQQEGGQSENSSPDVEPETSSEGTQGAAEQPKAKFTFAKPISGTPK